MELAWVDGGVDGIPCCNYPSPDVNFINYVANVKRRSLLNYLRENRCLYIQESIEPGGSLWKSMDWKYWWRVKTRV
jgi:hypothetical protein